MRMNRQSSKNLLLLAALVLTLAVAMLAVQPAQAAGVCPAPGTGMAGAYNMVHDATMLSIPMARDAVQGNIGMHNAVVNTSCP